MIDDPIREAERNEREERSRVTGVKPGFSDSAILELSELLTLKLPERKVYLYPWLREGTITLVSAWRGTGKTQLGLSLALSLAAGEKFGPWEGEEAVPVCYLDGEMVLDDVIERINQIGISQTIEPLYFYNSAYSALLNLPSPKINDPDFQKFFYGYLVEKRIKVLFIDNIGSLTPGMDENSKMEWDVVNQWLLELRSAGMAIIAIHHTGNSGKQRGTSGREDNIDNSIILERPKDYKSEDGCKFNLTFTKCRCKHTDLHLIADISLQFIEDDMGGMVWTFDKKRLPKKIEILKLTDQGKNPAEIEESLDVSKGYISKVIAEAKKKSWISKEGKFTPTGYQHFQSEMS
ncbi:MAG: hypothetical protein FJ135_04790 [Deltaproteobacteria bacterium]|nr:hypothetical protein [Deltaproteobacteria bacterium]